MLGKEGGEGKLVMGKCCSPPVTGYHFFSWLTLTCHWSSPFSGFPSAVLLGGPWASSLVCSGAPSAQFSEVGHTRYWWAAIPARPGDDKLGYIPWGSQPVEMQAAPPPCHPFSHFLPSCSEWHSDMSPYLLPEEVLHSCKCSLTQKGFS